MDKYSDEKIVDSWMKNASPWVNAVRSGQIESRKLVTDQAIVEAVLNRSPDSLLDIGCGEGWLIRKLSNDVNHLVGVDVVPDLIEKAMAAGDGSFFVSSYEAIAAGDIKETFDVVTCNFSLIGKSSVEALFKSVSALLKPHGVFIVQTLHPAASGVSPYRDGWREGSWSGFSSDFTDPAPWYFRTLESWVCLFKTSHLNLLEIREPVHPKTQMPSSVIFIGSVLAE